jgi:hypothetical protein
MLVLGAPREVRVRVEVRVDVGECVGPARTTLQDAARGLRATMHMIVDRCGTTARWE